MQPIYLTTLELAARWAAKYPFPLNKRTIDNWRYMGKGPAYCKQRGRVLYKLEDVEAFEAAGGVLRQVREVK